MRKRALTLLEIMIVIFLITLITGTIGYSMRGTLDKGRAFRTEQAKQQLQDLLLISLAEHPGKAEEIARDPGSYLKELDLAKDPEALLVDGWKHKFQVTAQKGGKDFTIYSDSYEKYEAKRQRNNPNNKTASDEEE